MVLDEMGEQQSCVDATLGLLASCVLLDDESLDAEHSGGIDDDDFWRN